MSDACKVDNQQCPNPPKFYYMWDWGEDGVCCDDHRQWLQSRSGQLSRSITFTTLGTTAGRREYTPPKLRELPEDVGKLQMALSEASERTKKLETQIGRLESEREKSAEKMREQELRIQDLLNQKGMLVQQLADMTALASKPPTDEPKSETREVIEGADDAPATHGKGKRR